MLVPIGQNRMYRTRLMETLMSKSTGGQFGRLGIDWSLVLLVGGWIIQGAGIGLTVYKSIKAGSEQTGIGIKSGDLSSQDIAALASNMAAADKEGRSPQQWETMLTSMLGTGAPPIVPSPQVCPAGFYSDPATGACLPLQKAGFFADMGTGGMIALGVGGLLLAKMLKLI